MAAFTETNQAQPLFPERKTNISFELTQEEEMCGKEHLETQTPSEGKATRCVTSGKSQSLCEPNPHP